MPDDTKKGQDKPTQVQVTEIVVKVQDWNMIKAFWQEVPYKLAASPLGLMSQVEQQQLEIAPPQSSPTSQDVPTECQPGGSRR